MNDKDERERTLLKMERAAMDLEKLVDGAYQHLYKKHGIRSREFLKGYSDARRLREYFRRKLGSRQLTISTGAKNFNTKSWYFGIPSTLKLCCEVCGQQRSR